MVKIVTKAFVWYWIVAVIYPVGYLIWCLGYGMYASVMWAMFHSQYSITAMSMYGYKIAMREITVFLGDGLLSARVIAPSILFGIIGFIMSIMVYSYKDWKRG